MTCIHRIGWKRGWIFVRWVATIELHLSCQLIFLIDLIKRVSDEKLGAIMG